MVSAGGRLHLKAERFATRHARLRWLVVAPHADDETLGAGALIREAARRGTLAGVVFLTDGSGSHPCADEAARLRLVAVRRREADAALRVLTAGEVVPTLFLGWIDAHPPADDSADFAGARRRLTAWCRRLAVDALAVTSRHDTHCDHVAASRLADAVGRTAHRPIKVFEYAVWSDPALAAGDAGFVAIDASRGVGLRSAALRRHRTQLTPLMGDGFRLSPEQADLKRRPFDLLRKVNRSGAP